MCASLQWVCVRGCGSGEEGGVGRGGGGFSSCPKITGGLHGQAHDFRLFTAYQYFLFARLIVSDQRTTKQKAANPGDDSAHTQSPCELDLNPTQCLFKLNPPC